MSHSYPSLVARPWLKASLATLGFCGALLAAPAAHAQTKYEAEAATATRAGTGLFVDNTITGFTGSGYVNFNGNAPANSLTVSIPVSVTTAGVYNMVIRYESQFGTTQTGYAKTGAYQVNGGVLNKVYFNGTAPGIAGAPNFRSTSNLRVSLNAGTNTIVISDNGNGYFGVDFITISTAPAATTALTPTAAGRVEAELGQLAGTQALTRDDDTGTHSGDLYVSGFGEGTATAGSSIVLPVTVATAGLYEISVGARGQFSGKTFDMAVATSTYTGGNKLTTSVSESPNAFASYVVGKYNLTAGTNTITITSQTAYVEVDYVDIKATTGVVTATRAGAEAQKVLSAYPNPTSGQALNVSLELAAAQETTFDLVNALGQCVSSTTRNLRVGANQLQLPTSGVSGGIYQLVVRSGDQPLLLQRVVIN